MSEQLTFFAEDAPKGEKCPFCGSRNIKIKPLWKTYRFVNCLNCKACGPVAKTEDEALRMWNERANTHA